MMNIFKSKLDKLQTIWETFIFHDYGLYLHTSRQIKNNLYLHRSV